MFNPAFIVVLFEIWIFIGAILFTSLLLGWRALIAILDAIWSLPFVSRIRSHLLKPRSRSLLADIVLIAILTTALSLFLTPFFAPFLTPMAESFHETYKELLRP